MKLSYFFRLSLSLLVLTLITNKVSANDGMFTSQNYPHEPIASFQQLHTYDDFQDLEYLKTDYKVSNNTENYCQNIKNNSINNMLMNEENNIALNRPGFLGIGLCWWATRLQTKAAWLTQLNPSGRMPTSSKAREIVRKIMKGDEIVVIPGFKNLNEFGKKFSKEVDQVLSEKQLGDSWQAFTHNLTYPTYPSAQRLRNEIKSIVQQLDRGLTPYIFTKKSSKKIWRLTPVSHSLLALKYKRYTNVASKRECFEVIVRDPNFENISALIYCAGDRHAVFSGSISSLYSDILRWTYNSNNRVAFYAQRQIENERTQAVAKKICGVK